ncbi:type IV toxin-antitoxin system AbiEi family antitoxin domain-containing protein [Rhodococcus sp. B50]|uniref:type IV toxin-antitoxin system AbiEi family antitoxin domain-containing protein n=1 Tax=Rhodococcus sp. B50 TaxID=2682847 RepID=UPI001BD5DF5E|nr:hypothetical protein [Rhodococcus sp. B50]MBS9374227.1 hypothetical protein [Rhodococcus sp. B50]
MGEAQGHDLQHLFDTRSGLVTQTHLSRLGVGRGQVRHLLDTGRWQRVLQGVYAVSSGPLTRTMMLEAALLYGGDAAILIVHPGVVVHRSRAYAHIAVHRNPPRTTKADTALDLATAENTARDAYTSLIGSVTNGNIRLIDVRRRLEERPPYRYRRALADAVALLADGVQSVLEYRYAVDVEKAHGLPSALRQGPVTVDGRTLYGDCMYDSSGYALTVRLDGRRVHSMREVAFRDRRRDNAAELAGRARLVFGYEEVVRSPCAVAGEVATVLTRLGWVREKGACGACARFW